MTAAALLVILLFLQPSLQAGAPSPQQTEAQKEKSATVSTIDINQASEEDFAKLPGIGPELARRIVAFREKHGSFRRVEDLLVIKGIGHKKWKKIRPYVRVGNDKSNEVKKGGQRTKDKARRTKDERRRTTSFLR
jgi:comEA protein